MFGIKEQYYQRFDGGLSLNKLDKLSFQTNTVECITLKIKYVPIDFSYMDNETIVFEERCKNF